MNPNGRFEVGTKICLSISSHHEETWQAAWGVRTMLEAIVSFLPSYGAGAIGALEWPASERKKLAVESQSYVCSHCGPINDLIGEPGSYGSDDESVKKDGAGGELATQIAQLSFGTIPDKENESLNMKKEVFTEKEQPTSTSEGKNDTGEEGPSSLISPHPQPGRVGDATPLQDHRWNEVHSQKEKEKISLTQASSSKSDENETVTSASPAAAVVGITASSSSQLSTPSGTSNSVSTPSSASATTTARVRAMSESFQNNPAVTAAIAEANRRDTELNGSPNQQSPRTADRARTPGPAPRRVNLRQNTENTSEIERERGPGEGDVTEFPAPPKEGDVVDFALYSALLMLGLAIFLLFSVQLVHTINDEEEMS
jgi:hypothetical protein